MPEKKSLYYRNTGLWAPYYALLEQQLGPTATLIDIAGQRAKPNATTWTGRKFHASGLSPIWTPSAALSALAVPLDLADPDKWQRLAPILTLNGTNEKFSTPDAAYWSRVAGVFSTGVWVRISTAETGDMLCKGDAAGADEWFTALGSGAPQIRLVDESEIANPFIQTLADVALTVGVWHLVIFTCDGSANATGLDIYVDGVLVASTDTDQAGFINLEDLTALPVFGQSVLNGWLAADILGGPWSPWFAQVQLTAAQALNLYENMRLGLGI